MSLDEYGELYDAGKAAKEQDEFRIAAAYYTHAAYERLGTSEYLVESRDKPPGWLDIGRAFRCFLSAIYCHRRSQEPLRAANLAKQALLICEDLEANVASEPARRGWCYETMGDLRVFSGLNDAQNSYEKAADAYSHVDNIIGWLAEPEFDVMENPLFELADAADHEVPRRKKSRIKSTSFAERIAYKREHMPDLIAAIANDAKNESGET